MSLAAVFSCCDFRLLIFLGVILILGGLVAEWLAC